ncbi:MAG TPA: TolC family protein, partial [Anseongella sp.]|nr:TolC family protein [Anseongella sp.]
MDTHFCFFLRFGRGIAITAIMVGCQLLMSPESSAQQNLTLLQCIEYAVENNLDIEQARINERLSEVDLRQAKFDLAPDLNANASHQFSFGNAINPATNVNEGPANYSSGNLSLNSSLLLFAGF